MARTLAIVISIGVAMGLAACSPLSSKKVELGRHRFQVPAGVRVSLYPDPQGGADWMALRVTDFRDPTSALGRACDPLGDGPGYRIFVRVIPPSQPHMIGEVASDVVNNTDLAPAILPAEERLGAVEYLALGRLRNEAPRGLKSFGGGAPFVRCGQGCRVLFRIDDLLVDAGCGGDAHLDTTPKALRAFVLGTDRAIRAWRQK